MSCDYCWPGNCCGGPNCLHQRIEITPSCGCVFCDIGLKPIKMKRQYVHYVPKEGKIIICPISGAKPMSDGSKPGSKDPER